MPDGSISVTLGGQPLADAFFAKLARAEVRESDAEPTVAALRFDLSQTPAGEFDPLDDALLSPGARLRLELQAPGGNPARLFDGFVTHVRPHFQAIESDCYVEVLGMDAAVLLDAEERAAAYPNASDSDAADEIFGRYKDLDKSVDTTAAKHDEKKQLLVQRGTDWQFLQRLARRNGFACFLEADRQSGKVTAFFKKRDLTSAPQADLTVQREDANLRWIDLQYVMTGPVRRIGAAIDPIAKRMVRSTGTPDLPPLGGGLLDSDVENGLVQAGAKAATGMLRDPPPLDAAISAEGSAATDRALFAIEARGELSPALYRGLLRARRPVLVKGVGKVFTGAYYVRAVRTVWEAGELSQAFVAERNASGLSGKESFGQDAEEVPAQ